MRTFNNCSTLGHAMDNPESREFLEREIPDVLGTAPGQMRSFPIGGFLKFVLRAEPDRATALLETLYSMEDQTPQPAEPAPIETRPDYESEAVEGASASLTIDSVREKNRPVGLELTGPTHGNPFVDVDLTAVFRHDQASVTVGGFYDGQGKYKVRFLPPAAGPWTVEIKSNARSLHGVRAEFDVAEGSSRGPVRVSGTHHFAYADGTPYKPSGTTVYAWTHQDDPLQEQTLTELVRSPFNKLRMCLFPKDYLYNENEPERFVFERSNDDSWDTTRFDLGYFAKLEERIQQLDAAGIEADLILFHPYDRWGFSKLGKAADDRYVKYVVRRLAAYPNVWWSLANEYDLVTSKQPEDWQRIGKLVATEDHANHLLSNHNWVELFDFDSDWVTHCSIQTGEQHLAEKVGEWRRKYAKPVVIDECGYEGNLDQGWGSLTAQELVRRFWEATIAGGYATHGETYYSPGDIIWWAKGGKLIGESPARIEFLNRVVAESPTKRLDPLPSDWDSISGGVENEYILVYFGAGQPAFRNITIPAGMRAHIDVIDTWDMTINELPGTFEGTVRVDLPGRPYTAVRLRRASA